MGMPRQRRERSDVPKGYQGTVIGDVLLLKPFPFRWNRNGGSTANYGFTSNVLLRVLPVSA
jgi:hypothetical protein